MKKLNTPTLVEKNVNLERMISRAAVLTLLTVFTFACATQKVEKEQMPEPIQVDPTPIVKKVEPKPTPIVDNKIDVSPTPPTNQSIVYFNFDSSKIDSQAENVIYKHIQFLRKNPNFTITLEGHADARGDDDYNKALGNSRAMAIKEILISENIDESKINIVSFGENKPAISGDSEIARSFNRRAKFVYNNVNYAQK